MKKILFLTNRNILTTSGEMRLVKNRAESLYNDYNVASDFIVVQKKERVFSKQREYINAGGNLYSIELSIKNLFILIIKIVKKIHEVTKENDYDAVVFSGVGMLFFSCFFSRKMKLFCDVHGASEDALEMANKQVVRKKIFFRFIYYLDVLCMKFFSHRMDGFFVVTDALKEYLRKKYSMKKNVDFMIVPCATQKEESLFENYEKYRAIYRKKYGIDQDEIVFVYSGGVSTWQCIPQTIALYEKIEKTLNQKTKLLIFSHRKDYFEKFANTNKSIIIDSYGPDELSKALFVGDFAFMLRENCITNNVAFPNKFLEYVQSRMKIITTPYVFEVSKQIEEYKLGFIYDFSDDVQKVASYISNHKVNEINVVLDVLKKNSFQNRLMEINKVLEKND